MNLNWIKKYYKVININIIVIIALFNIVGYFIMDQDKFNNLSRKIQNHPLSSYVVPNTKKYNNGNILFVGDSYTQGSGDAFMDGIEKYSVAHMYAEYYKINVHNAGMGGYGSIRAVRNAIWIDKILSKNPFINDIPKIDKIVFFFYEGNDLNNNINENKEFNNPKSLKDFIEISQPSNKDFLLHSYFQGFYNIVYLVPSVYGKIKQILYPYYNKYWNNIGVRKQSKSGNTIVTKDGDKWETGTFQSAAVELNEDEIKENIVVFENSLVALKNYFNVKRIEVVYLPSVATTYDNLLLNINIQSYMERKTIISNLENKEKSLFIRNEIRKMTHKNGLKFIDTTDYIRDFAENNIIHGPKDRKHFNLTGYKKVFEFIRNNQ